MAVIAWGSRRMGQSTMASRTDFELLTKDALFGEVAVIPVEHQVAQRNAVAAHRSRRRAEAPPSQHPAEKGSLEKTAITTVGVVMCNTNTYFQYFHLNIFDIDSHQYISV